MTTQTTDPDPVTAAINRLPGIIQEDVHRLLALQGDALARAHEPEICNDDEALFAAAAIVHAYNAALHMVSAAFGEPDLDLNPPGQDEDDEPECFDGSLNIDAGSLAPEFPPFLRAQLDRRADAIREKHAR